MNDMIERVARALAPLAWATLGLSDTLANQATRTASLRRARAAIKAMREPTEAMRQCGVHGQWSGVIEGIPEDERDAATSLWQAMIDAALAEP